MSRHLIIAFVLLLGACIQQPGTSEPVAAPAAFPSGTLVDLTHVYDDNTLFWPTADLFRLESVADGITDAGYYYAANTFTTAEHGGTHVDAPLHFAKGQDSVDGIPLRRLVAPAAVVDVSGASDRDPDYQVTRSDIEAWEAEHGQIPAGSILLVRTGFASRWPDAERYLGTRERGQAAVPLLHFPGLHPDLAVWLVENRSIGAVGIDTASIDYGQSTLFETHRTLFAANIPAMENLAALDQLPPTGAYVIALPMKIAGGSGAPLRAIAIIP